jgi:predicted HicB family RNase H-like nuclease
MGKQGDLSQFAQRQREKSEAALQEEQRAREEPTKRLNANVPESLHRAVKLEAARRGVDMKAIMVDALREYLPSYSDE